MTTTYPDQESDIMTDHRAEADDFIEEVWMDAGDLAQVHALLAIHDTLTEIRDRLPERVEAKVAPFDPDVIAANLEAIKHEAETPMRGHGECCEPAPADVEDERIGAWHRVAGHPFFRGCYAQERPLIDAMLDSLTLAATAAETVHNHGPAQGRGLDCREREDGHGHLRGVCMESAPADVDPGEALEKALRAAFEGRDEMSWAEVARVAREHIEAERPPETDWEGIYLSERRKREKAESDLARVTKERDWWRDAARRHVAEQGAVEKERDALADRVEALRKSIAFERDDHGLGLKECMTSILARDTERAES